MHSVYRVRDWPKDLQIEMEVTHKGRGTSWNLYGFKFWNWRLWNRHIFHIDVKFKIPAGEKICSDVETIIFENMHKEESKLMYDVKIVPIVHFGVEKSEEAQEITKSMELCAGNSLGTPSHIKFFVLQNLEKTVCESKVFVVYSPK